MKLRRPFHCGLPMTRDGYVEFADGSTAVTWLCRTCLDLWDEREIEEAVGHPYRPEYRDKAADTSPMTRQGKPS